MPDLPIACTLTPEAIKAGRLGLFPGLMARAEHLELHRDGYRARFRADDETLTAVIETVNAERRCCQFLRFQITVEASGGPVWLDVTGPSGTREFLDALMNG